MAIKHPRVRHWKLPFKRRFSFLREHVYAGRYSVDFDDINRRKAFDFHRRNALPKIDTQACYICNKVAEHWHHIVPICKGGDDTGLNLVPLCKQCHRRVHRRSLVRPNRMRIPYLNPFGIPEQTIVIIPPEKST